MIEFDHALLEQFEYGKETHNDLDAVDEVGGERPEGHLADAGQLLDELLDRLGDGDLDRGHM